MVAVPSSYCERLSFTPFLEVLLIFLMEKIMGSDCGPGLACNVSIFRQKSIDGIKRGAIMVDASIISIDREMKCPSPSKPLPRVLETSTLIVYHFSAMDVR